MEAVNDDTSTIGYEWSDPGENSETAEDDEREDHVTSDSMGQSVSSSGESNNTRTCEESDESDETNSSNDDSSALYFCDTKRNNDSDKVCYFVKNVCDKEKGIRVTISRKPFSHDQEVVNPQSTFFVAEKKQRNKKHENKPVHTVEINNEKQFKANYEGSMSSEINETVPDKIAQGRGPGFPRKINRMETDNGFVIGERQSRELDISTSEPVCDGDLAIDEMDVGPETSAVNDRELTHIKPHQTDAKVTVIDHGNDKPLHDFSPSRLSKQSPLRTRKQELFSCHPGDKTPTETLNPQISLDTDSGSEFQESQTQNSHERDVNQNVSGSTIIYQSSTTEMNKESVS